MKNKNNLIRYYDKEMNTELIFKYIYQGDTTYLLLNENDEIITYIDLDNFDIDIDNIKTRLDEENIIIDIIDFMLNDYDYLLRYVILDRLIK